MTKQMEAVLMIAEHPLMKHRLLPRIDVKNESIDWEGAADGMSGGEKALISWAFCIWNDTQIPHDEHENELVSIAGFWRDPFEGFGVMGPDLQLLVLKALAHRHGTMKPPGALETFLRKKGEEMGST